MRQVFFLLVLFFCLNNVVSAQVNYVQEGRDGIYQIYLGEAVFGTEAEQFDNVAQYGFLRPFSIADQPQRSITGKSPIFLGPYLGRATANQILKLVREAGYPSAYIEGDEVSLTTDEGAQLTHTVQVGAFEKLDASFYDEVSNQPAHGIFILYEEGLYKVCAGLYHVDSKPYLKENAVSYWKNALSIPIKPFVRPFRFAYETGR